MRWHGRPAQPSPGKRSKACGDWRSGRCTERESIVEAEEPNMSHCPRCATRLGLSLLLASQSIAAHPAGWTATLGRLREGQEEYAVHVDRKVKHTGNASCCI